MTRRTIRLLSIQFSIAAIAAAAAHLQVGDPLPSLSGDTISGKPLQLPAAGAGSNRVVLFSFSKTAGADSQLWNERLIEDLGPSSQIVTYRAIVLESVPRLFRWMAISGIKSGMPPALWDKTILLYKDEDPWKKRLAVSTDKNCYVVLLDSEGRIHWNGSGPFTDSKYAPLRNALSQLQR